MTYQDRADIDQLIKDVGNLKDMVGDDIEALATVKSVQEVLDKLETEYYDKSQTYSKEEIDEMINNL